MSVERRFFVNSDELVFDNPVKEKKWEEGQGVYERHATKIQHTEEENGQCLGVDEFNVEYLSF